MQMQVPTVTPVAALGLVAVVVAPAQQELQHLLQRLVPEVKDSHLAFLVRLNAMPLVVVVARQTVLSELPELVLTARQLVQLLELTTHQPHQQLQTPAPAVVPEV